MIVHLLEYRVVAGHDVEVTGFLRHETLGQPVPDGLVARFVGRRLSHRGREHLAVTIWRDADSYVRGTDSAGVPEYLAAQASLLGDRVSSGYRVMASTGLGSDEARILRVYRASVAANSVELWTRLALDPIGQLVSRPGLLSVVAGIGLDSDEAHPQSGDVPIVILTAWTEWDPLLTAAGPRIGAELQQADVSDLERHARTDHFEILRAEPGSE